MTTENGSKQVATTTFREIGFSDTGAGLDVSPQSLGEAVKFGELMAKAGTAVRKHLREQPGACTRIVLQAMKWQMDPFAVGDKTYFVNDMIAYEAQLIAAVIISRSGIVGRPRYTYTGEGAKMRCTVECTFKDGTTAAYESPEVGTIKVKNSPLWQSDTQQQLGYYSIRAWARRHAPDIIMGVYDREEAESMGPDNARDITPQKSAAEQRYVKDIEHTAESAEQTPASKQDEPAAAGDFFSDTAPVAPSGGPAGAVEATDGVSPPSAPSVATPKKAAEKVTEKDAVIALTPEEGRLCEEFAKAVHIAIEPVPDDTPEMRQRTLKNTANMWKMDRFAGAPAHVMEVARRIIGAANAVILGGASFDDFPEAVDTIAQIVEPAPEPEKAPEAAEQVAGGAD